MNDNLPMEENQMIDNDDDEKLEIAQENGRALGSRPESPLVEVIPKRKSESTLKIICKCYPFLKSRIDS